MRCEDLDARMMDLLYEEELPGDERRALDQHLADCARCRAELDGLKATRVAARRVLDEAPPARVRAAILQAAVAAAERSRGSAAAGATARRETAPAPGPSFWERLRMRWALPTLATVGAIAVFLLASKLFLDPERTYERGREVVAPNEPAAGPPPPTEAPGEGQAALPPAAEPGRPAGKLADGTTDESAKERADAVAAERRRRVAEAKRRFAPPPPPKSDATSTRGSRAAGGMAAPPAAAPAKKAAAASPFDDAPLSGIGGGSRGRAAEASAPEQSAAEQDRESAIKRESPPTRASKPATARAERTGMGVGGTIAGSSSPAGGSGFAAPPAPRIPSPAPASAPTKAKIAARPLAESSQPIADKGAGAARSESKSRAAPREEAPAANGAPAEGSAAPRDSGGETLLQRADRLFAEGRWAPAAAAYRELLRQDPKHAEAARWRQRLGIAEARLAAERQAPATAAPPGPR